MTTTTHSPTTTDTMRATMAAWTSLIDPYSTTARTLCNILGPIDALEALRTGKLPKHLPHDLTTPRAKQELNSWQQTFKYSPPLTLGHQHLNVSKELDIRLIIPSDAEWPDQLDPSNHSHPAALWATGPLTLTQATRNSATLLSPDNPTEQDLTTAANMARNLAADGCTVWTAGLDGAAQAIHRTTEATPPTAAVLNNPIHFDLPKTITQQGLLISPHGPGRNTLINTPHTNAHRHIATLITTRTLHTTN